MLINLVGRVQDIYEGEKSNSVTFTDTLDGGSIKLGMPKNLSFKMDGLYDMTIKAKQVPGEKGPYFRVLDVKTNSKTL